MNDESELLVTVFDQVIQNFEDSAVMARYLNGMNVDAVTEDGVLSKEKLIESIVAFMVTNNIDRAAVKEDVFHNEKMKEAERTQREMESLDDIDLDEAVGSKWGNF